MTFSSSSVPFAGTLLQVVPRGSVYVFPLKGQGHYWEGPHLSAGDVLMYVRPACIADLQDDLVFGVINFGAQYFVGLFNERLVVFKLPDGSFVHLAPPGSSGETEK